MKIFSTPLSAGCFDDAAEKWQAILDLPAASTAVVAAIASGSERDVDDGSESSGSSDA